MNLTRLQNGIFILLSCAVMFSCGGGGDGGGGGGGGGSGAISSPAPAPGGGGTGSGGSGAISSPTGGGGTQVGGAPSGGSGTSLNQEMQGIYVLGSFSVLAGSTNSYTLMYSDPEGDTAQNIQWSATGGTFSTLPTDPPTKTNITWNTAGYKNISVSFSDPQGRFYGYFIYTITVNAPPSTGGGGGTGVSCATTPSTPFDMTVGGYIRPEGSDLDFFVTLEDGSGTRIYTMERVSVPEKIFNVKVVPIPAGLTVDQNKLWIASSDLTVDSVFLSWTCSDNFQRRTVMIYDQGPNFYIKFPSPLVFSRPTAP